ncbi:lipoprotein-releasing ABC transporter permease subunit LolE [Xenorhabdus nematophila]|uniref:Transport protein of outer membrane lipoproteins (ABC superfamily, membrane) n=1 Tax=Xenorhabdus nematophila (strain ATCC 19061 / DSM 3370 / CCUG 14189 / LMG 1036 / NCIMB 9965 / AN6) TaxID=406817 RepID=D3VID2_XENNA|nr:lipoprotein-releasing ABC transporter permease subunit LolE [Xenorhabdus nematophila]CEE90206.1 transport protein of outer membrane lipoproteins (ABC superfamily, membrane) [Xenorhabdus nematophila str. Anatoliense]CEF32448.1 transport protein of outer membrane lipoproteins (ABC superfamily, membrane) [Xenorhabdus nematophila str. Websteri]AYA39946.1 lipoprotein-releasing ABC transporter permease subunit LolE [Xenorhabdus nematophila]MBA0018580.1 lipoprotein-releasing ABC transporter permeas
MANLPLALFTALRFSKGRRRSGMVSLISVISTLGIMLGVAVLIIGLSAMNGFERELNNRILSVVPHGQIYAVNQPFHDWEQSLERVRRTSGIAGASPYIEFTGLMERGEKLHAVQVRGVDLASESDVSTLPQFVRDGAWKTFSAGKNQVILGQGVAHSLHVKQGDWLTVMIPNSDPSLKLLQPKRIRLQVAGIFQLSGILDHSLALVPLVDAQKYLDYGHAITGIAIKADDVFAAEQRVWDAGNATGQYVYISTWIKDYGYMYNDIQMVRSIMYLAMVLVIGVACFNIISTLIMAVKDKSSDIAVLRTLGAKDGHIRAIFLWYGSLTGMIGSFIGAVVGVFTSLNLTTMMKGLEKLLGQQFLSGDIYFIDFLPSELHVMDVFYVLLTALILSLLASWYPARRASKLDPARILSGQ